MKKLSFAFIAAVMLILAGCSSEGTNHAKDSTSGTDSTKLTVLKVGATPLPHAEILNFIKPELKKEGVDLQVVEFTDYVTPNISLSDKSLDANFFQTKQYLDVMNKERNLGLVAIADIHVEPMGLYSKKIKSIDELKDGDSIAVPNDPSNEGRALLLLQAHGLIKLKDPTSLVSTENDIVENPKKLAIKPLDSALLPKNLSDVTAAVINGNFALEAGLKPQDAVIAEDKTSPYGNWLVVRKDEVNNPAILKLKAALQSQSVKDYIEAHFKGSVIPAF
ncbi:MetQ/NlpA family ABC transporter substrate-binding protein [Helicobacter sp. 11S02629-2]|uniref:MetQ/NlpA family ABC transporter substrate-binding protein n=1 Tax=Helicobacter sp. 11S02629-2 TaxID=1476195 RepID=UPI000BA6D181|nr:MetQ/NlpA family ABC transporter substrate-binding protein [Helicobacter sp. 11S02629-2]PAF42082.1 methionine ABC transporter substrate-binding protein [Helicobacter sp. 11S02629-2]